MSIKLELPVKYVSVWDNGTVEVECDATLDLDLGTVTNFGESNLSEEEIGKLSTLDFEYVEYEDFRLPVDDNIVDEDLLHEFMNSVGFSADFLCPVVKQYVKELGLWGQNSECLVYGGEVQLTYEGPCETRRSIFFEAAYINHQTLIGILIYIGDHIQDSIDSFDPDDEFAEIWHPKTMSPLQLAEDLIADTEFFRNVDCYAPGANLLQ